MANTQAICNSFKSEQWCGIHALGTTVVRGATTKDTLKGALYLASASLGAGTTVYSATGEITGTNYTAGGATVTNATEPSVSGSTGIWTPSASLVWANLTQATAFDALFLYNSTQGNKAIAVYNFGSQTITAGTFTLTMPTNDASNALLRAA
jgi:hypothetical protein